MTTQNARYQHAQRDTEALAVTNLKKREIRWAGDTRRFVGLLEGGTVIYEGGQGGPRHAERWPNLIDALAAAANVSVEIEISTTMTLTADTTFTDANPFSIVKGGVIALNGFTLTCPIPDVGRFQWISGTGSVVWLPGPGKSVKPEWYGAAGAYAVGGAVMTSGSAALTTLGAAAVFKASDVGKSIYVRGAGVAGADLRSTIATYLSPSSVTLANTASTSMSDRLMEFGVDCASAIQSALEDARASQVELSFGHGSYFIASGLSVTGDGTPIRWTGQGKYYTYIRAVSASPFSAMLSLTDTDDAGLAASYTNYAARSEIEGVSFDGGASISSYPTHSVGSAAVASYGIRGVSNHTTLKNMRVQGTGVADIDLGYAFSSSLWNVDCENSVGDGICFNRNGSNNSIRLFGCEVTAHKGWGVRANSCSTFIINGGGIETCDKGAIFFEYSVKGYVVDGMYFEANGQTGWTFTADTSGAITLGAIKTNILVNGSSVTTTISNSLECSGSVRNHRTSPGAADYHVFCPGQNALLVEAVELASGDVGFLVGQYASVSTTNPNARTSFDSIRITNCPGWIKTSSGLFKALSLGYDVISAPCPSAFIDAATQRNLAETNMSRWALLTGGTAGSNFNKSTVILPSDPTAEVYELTLSTTGASHVFGFSLDAADYVPYQGKYMLFSVWMKHTDIADMTGIISLNPQGATRQVALDYKSSGDVGWQRVTGLFLMPTSGTIQFAVQKIERNAGAVGNLYVASPVLCEFGSSLTVLENDCPKEAFRTAATGITASTTQTQGQMPLTAEVNIVSTVANASDTVTLRLATQGRTQFIRNNGANVLQIYPATGDAINGGSVNASVTLNPGAAVRFVTADATNWYADFEDLHTTETGITASTTQTQGQRPLTKRINIISTCANANDTVTLPSAVAGMEVYIRNNGAQTLKIFPASGDNINGTGANTAVTLAAAASVTYRTADTTNWYS